MIRTEDAYDINRLSARLGGTIFGGRVRWFATAGSTNRMAMQEAEAGAPAGSVYVADEQTEGRGRGGKRWNSRSGEGLYVSVILRPAVAPADVLWFSLGAGLATRQAVHEVTSLDADIRWPNDLLLGGRKFCGILAELNAEVTRVRHLVIGVGINVHQQSFPEELKDATSLAIETGKHWRREEILVAFLSALSRESAAMDRDPQAAAADIRQRMESYSSWVRGKPVQVEEGGGYRGVTAGLDPRGFLLVQTSGGLRTVLSGGVRGQGTRDSASPPAGN